MIQILRPFHISLALFSRPSIYGLSVFFLFAQGCSSLQSVSGSGSKSLSSRGVNTQGLSSHKCIQNWGALELGSGTAKAAVVRVDTCRGGQGQGQILDVLFADRRPTAFRDHLKNNKIDRAYYRGPGWSGIAELVAEINKHEPSKVLGVATAVFRQAQNGKEVLSYYQRKTGIPIQVIGQDEEAELGVLSAIKALKLLETKKPTRAEDSPKNSGEKSTQNLAENVPVNPPVNLTGQSPGRVIFLNSDQNKARASDWVVWDIGGGSMQISSVQLRSPDSAVGIEISSIYHGNMASVSFKDMVVSKVLGLDPQANKTPNPLGRKKAMEALELAQKQAKDFLPKDIKKFSNTRWIGLGGVLSRSVRDQVDPNSSRLKLSQIEKTLRQRSSLSDDQLGSAYASTQVTNLALVAGFMKSAGLSQIEVVEADLTLGVLAHELLFTGSQSNAN